MRARFSSETLPRLWITRSTVATDTPAMRAMSTDADRGMFVVGHGLRCSSALHRQSYKIFENSKCVRTHLTIRAKRPDPKWNGIKKAVMIRFIGSLQLSYRRIGNEKVTVYFSAFALKYRISNN